MSEASYTRTRYGLKNSIVAVSFKVVFLLLGFFSRKIFLAKLGTELLGLDQMAASLLDFLNLLELGIGSAICFSLYKPLFDKDTDNVRDICALQGWLYRRIAFFILMGGIVLCFFFPSIFRKIELPIWYAYACFAVQMFCSLLGYFANYKILVFYADQKQYKVQLRYDSISIAATLIQMAAMLYAPGNPFIWYLVISVVSSVISSIVINVAISHQYPYLRQKVEKPRNLLKKFPEVLTKTKQLFIHRIGGFIITRSSTFVIYAYASLSMITLYGNYCVLTNSLLSLIDALFANLSAGIGNLASEKDERLSMKVIRELFCVRFLILGVCATCLWILTQSFIPIWLGDQFLLEDRTLILIILLFVFTGYRNLLDTYTVGYGLFQDVWCPFTEASINVAMSVLLGRYFGLDGILTGLLISYLFIVLWKPILIFRKGLQKSFIHYVKMVLKFSTVTLASTALILLLHHLIPYTPKDILSFIVYGSIVFIASAITNFAAFYLTEEGMRTFTARILITISRR